MRSQTNLWRGSCTAWALCLGLAATLMSSAAEARSLSERYTPKSPYRAINEFGVIPSAESGAVLEVYAKPGASGMKYFCAAAEFAQRFLRSQPSDRLVISRAEGPSATRAGSTSVLFDIVPRAQAQGLPSGGVTLSPNRVGENRSVNSGKSFCKPPDRRRDDD
ncbi:hypothetical protein [Dinoroseobacter sp. S76]|uniref:hypothetical protein n=1 Tax=Dinoroseobacter sp. S76 TaxID=3415124 RepID=UPI003C79FD49